MSDEETTRPVRMSPELMETFASRSTEGYRLTWDWGEPDEEGFYTPTVTTHGDDRLVPEITEERLAAAITSLAHGRCCWDAPEDAREILAEYARLLATPVTPEGGDL